jgi:hypothetical protein
MIFQGFLLRKPGYRRYGFEIIVVRLRAAYVFERFLQARHVLIAKDLPAGGNAAQQDRTKHEKPPIEQACVRFGMSRHKYRQLKVADRNPS